GGGGGVGGALGRAGAPRRGGGVGAGPERGGGGEGVEVPFRLTRRDRLVSADALLVASSGVADLVAVCRALPGGWPAAFGIAGGFVVVPAGPVAHGVPRTVRLRRLAGDPFLPADPHLLPPPPPDEAAGPTRRPRPALPPPRTVL